MTLRRADLLATALFWQHNDSVVVDIYVSGIGANKEIVLVQAVRTALSLAGRQLSEVTRQFVEDVLNLCEKSKPFAKEGLTLDRVLGKSDREKVLTAQLEGHDKRQQFPSYSSPVERSAALYNFSLNFLPSTINEFIAAYEGISVSAFKSRLNRARAAGLLKQTTDSRKRAGAKNAR